MQNDVKMVVKDIRCGYATGFIYLGLGSTGGHFQMR